MNWELLTGALNVVSFVTFVALLGAAGARMLWRLWNYYRAKVRPSIILRRDFGLLVALFLVFGSSALLRAFGWTDEIQQNGPARFAFLFFASLVANGALFYWVWAEYFIVGHPDKENE